MSDLTQNRLHDLLHYDPETGIFRWRVTRYRVHAGDRAGNENRSRPDDPYRQIMIDQVNYRDARLAWFYMTGKWPDHEIDHRNGNPLDCTWSNLRSATSRQNKANQHIRRDNKSGFKGVHPHGRRFYARTKINGKYQYLGIFDTAEEASSRYRTVTSAIHGEFARHD